VHRIKLTLVKSVNLLWLKAIYVQHKIYRRIVITEINSAACYRNVPDITTRSRFVICIIKMWRNVNIGNLVWTAVYISNWLMDLFIHVLIVLLFVSCIHLYFPYIVCPKFFIRINPNFTALIITPYCTNIYLYYA